MARLPAAAIPGRKPRARDLKAPDRYRRLMDGTMSVEDLDIEEIQRGQMRDKNGTFTGRPANMIPRAMHVKLVQELMRRMDDNWREHATEALAVFVEVMNNPKVRPQDRLYAAQYVVERIQGKIPDKQIVTATVQKWETVAEKIIVEMSDDVIEGEVVESSPAALPAPTPRKAK